VGYGFRKIYADLVTDDGTVCVAYLSWVRLARRWRGMGGVELYHPDGQREILHATAEPPLVDEATPVGAIPFVLQVGEARFELEYATDHGAWTPEPDCPIGALRWRVKQAQGRGTARWTGCDRPPLEGRGYVDWVQIDRPTRLLGFRELRWGRVHLPDRTVIVEGLAAKGGVDWRPGLDWTFGEAPVTGEARFDLDDGAGRVTVVGGGEPIDLEPIRVLHDGDAFDPARIPSRIERALCVAVGGPTFETRWIARARSGGQEGWALHERVRFGR
jgi:hypothetical protein